MSVFIIIWNLQNCRLSLKGNWEAEVRIEPYSSRNNTVKECVLWLFCTLLVNFLLHIHWYLPICFLRGQCCKLYVKEQVALPYEIYCFLLLLFKQNLLLIVYCDHHSNTCTNCIFIVNALTRIVRYRFQNLERKHKWQENDSLLTVSGVRFSETVEKESLCGVWLCINP